MRPKFIRVIAICVFYHDEKILVFEAFDSVKNKPFYRPLGGAVEPGETSQAAIVREIREELGFEVVNLRLIGVLENLFTYEGEPSHEIVFVYDGEFVDRSVYNPPRLKGQEHDGTPISAVWRRVDSFDAYNRLVPEGLPSLLANCASNKGAAPTKSTVCC